MIEGLLQGDVNAVEYVHGLSGILVAIVTITVTLLKARKVLYKRLVVPILEVCESRSKAKEEERIKKVFLELEPMIEERIHKTLNQYEEVLHDQQVTLRGSISESVEFKTFVTTSMLSLQTSIEKLVLSVDRNSQDLERIQEYLSNLKSKGAK